MARRRSAARVLVLATFRRADALAVDHPIAPLFAELELKRLATNVAITPFGLGDALAVLEAHLGPTSDSESLARLLVARSNGNPLFITTLLDYLVGSGTLAESDGVWHASIPLEKIAEIVPDRLRSASPRPRDPATASRCASSGRLQPRACSRRATWAARRE